MKLTKALHAWVSRVEAKGAIGRDNARYCSSMPAAGAHLMHKLLLTVFGVSVAVSDYMCDAPLAPEPGGERQSSLLGQRRRDRCISRRAFVSIRVDRLILLPVC